MSQVTYRIVEHDGGWAYSVDGVFSETYPSHDAARHAAEIAAAEQGVGGDTAGIVYEDAKGAWHEEIADGGDRPSTNVEG
jgi:hypothetical protein